MRHLTIAAATVALVAASSPQTRAAGASPSRVTFGHLTVEDGLAHSYVQAILKDSQGFMWFGTEDGLNRWDGKEFRVYRPQAGDARSLISPTVGVLFEDSKKRLWTGTANRLAWGQGGLALYDRDSDSFTRYMRGDRSDTLSGMAIQAITEDRQGFLWIGTEKGLNRFDPEHNVFTRHQHDPGNPHSLSDDYVNCVLEDRAGRLWVGTNNGLNRFDRATNSFYRWPQDSLPHPNVSALYEDATQKLWVGSMGGGLSRLDPATGQVTRFLPIPNDPTSLSHPNVRRLAGDGRGTLYVGTENGGLNTLDPVSHRFSRFLPNPEDPTSPNSASIYALYLDEHGTLWIGSYNGGVDILSQYAQRFEYIRAGRGRLSDPHVTAVIEDHTGDLWIGTDGGGLNRRDHETGRFTDYRHDPADQGSIASDVVLSLWEDRQGDIWIGGFPGGLAQLDRQTGRCRRYQIDASDTRRDTVRQIGEYGDNQLLIANGRGLETFDRRTHRFTPLASKYPDLPLETAFSYALHPDGSVWIACPEVGAVRLEPATGKVAIYRSKSGDPSTALTPGDAQAVFVDSRGNTWLGTIGGLTCFQSGTRMIRRYTTADGLPSATVASILEDADGSLWLGTTRGLSRFVDAVRLPQKPTFVNFDVLDGLQGYEFRYGAAFRSHGGEMLFGGQRGVNAFFPGKIAKNENVPPVVLTGLKLFNRPVPIATAGSPLAKQISQTQEITLSSKQSVVTFEFASLDYVIPQKNRHAYRLEPLESEWNEVGNLRSATYTSLPAGKYVFRVRGSNNDGVWNNAGVSLRLRVLPPWYRTWSFLLSICGLLAIGLAAGLRLRVRAMEIRRKDLERQVEERTGELQREIAGHKRTEERLQDENEQRRRAEEEARRAEEEARRAAEETAHANRALEDHRLELEREVAERKRAEEEAGRERDLLHVLMDNTPDLIYFKDAHSRFTRVNRAQAAALGVESPEAALGRSDLDFYPPEFAQGTVESERRLMRSGQALIGHLEHDKQRDRFYLASKVPLRDTAGAVVGLVGISKDVTATKQAEQKLERDLEEFLAIVSAVSQGDLTPRGREGEEVLGRIASGFNAMLGAFAEILAEVRGTILSVSTSSTEILAASTEIAKGAEHGSLKVNETSAAVEEMAASMVQVSRNSEASAAAAKAVLEHVREGEQSVSAAHEGMARIDSAVGETAEKMKLLDKRSREIFEVIEFIQEIASQSELLSLNAAIQAAHAGEAGRGFSVVADEIRRLAERSKTASRDVSRIVEGIVEEVRTVLGAMRLATDEVKAERGLSERARASLREIEALVARSATLASQISLASHEQAQATHTVSESMQSIASMTTESAAGAREAARAVEHLTRLADDLSRAISRFRVAERP